MIIEVTTKPRKDVMHAKLGKETHFCVREPSIMRKFQ